MTIFRPNIPYSNATRDIATLEATIGNNLNAATSSLTVPYPMMSPSNFMQQTAFPFRSEITPSAITNDPHTSAAVATAAAAAAAAVFNIAAATNATTPTSMLQNATATAAFDPYATAQMAAAASQLLHEQQVIQQIQANKCSVNNTTNGYHRNEVII